MLQISLVKVFTFEKSTYVGVSWSAATCKWVVKRTANGKEQHGGYFADELEAARRSDMVAKETGNTGKLNFPSAEEVRKNPRKRKKSSPQKPRKRRRRGAQKKVT